MDLKKLFFRERSVSKVAATFSDRAHAEMTAREVQRAAALEGSQLQLVRPHDRDWGRKVEPEGVGIWRTAIRAHVTCGIAGLLAGVGLYALLRALELPLVESSPVIALVVALFFPTVFGLMIGGLLTLRPDHDPVIDSVREASSDGRWSLVVHPVNDAQLDAAERVLAVHRVPAFKTL
jgi:hypothetical protein